MGSRIRRIEDREEEEREGKGEKEGAGEEG